MKFSKALKRRLAGGFITRLVKICGSGTTLLAAKDSGCKSVGVDSSKSYIEIARKRLLREAEA